MMTQIEMDRLITGTALHLGIPEGTIRQWRCRGKVPFARREDIREALAAQNIQLPRSAYDQFGFGRVAA